mmetsp:Transcript_82030/g.100651  ORF Transcript_82030/g.100651 Transcript_82030/m.100651 type:complete len:142 (-) Transcript_82030:171-596(-)
MSEHRHKANDDQDHIGIEQQLSEEGLQNAPAPQDLATQHGEKDSHDDKGHDRGGALEAKTREAGAAAAPFPLIRGEFLGLSHTATSAGIRVIPIEVARGTVISTGIVILHDAPPGDRAKGHCQDHQNQDEEQVANFEPSTT